MDNQKYIKYGQYGSLLYAKGDILILTDILTLSSNITGEL